MNARNVQKYQKQQYLISYSVIVGVVAVVHWWYQFLTLSKVSSEP